MLKNYTIIALRFMVRQKGFSIINIAGLTIGIASSLLILLYIQDELHYDTFHRDGNRIFRITQEGQVQGKVINSAYTGFPLSTTLEEEPQVEASLRLANWATFPMRFNDQVFTERNLILADADFFGFFDFVLLEGDPQTVLQGEGKIVLTESAARRYFNYDGNKSASPIGRQMVLAQGYTATVTGIAADPPAHSHFHFTVILSLDSWKEVVTEKWTASTVITYVKMKPNAGQHALQQILTNFTNLYVVPELKKSRNINVLESRTPGNHLQFGIQPLTDIHLTSSLTDEIEENGDYQYIYLFAAIGVLITLLACINFMNLSTARSASRAREVGVRKSVGASNARLVWQFLLESYFYITIAVVMAFFIIMIVLGPFNILTHKHLDSASLLSGRFLTGIVLFVLIVGLLAGSYPAFYLTRFKPIDTLRGILYTRMRSYSIRNVLVVFQFFISAGLIIATLTVYLQLRHTQTIELGFDKHNVINLLHTKNLGKHGDEFKKALLKQPEIVAASYSNRLPPNVDWQYLFRSVGSSKDFLVNVYEVDYEHLKTMKYAMVTGRFFSPDFPSDSVAVILNETAARRMNVKGLHDQKLDTDYGNPSSRTREIIGIIQDFNFQSLQDSIHPIALVLGPQPNWEMAIRYENGKAEQALKTIQTLWKKWAPTAPFEYNFVERNFDRKMTTIKKIGLLFLLFTILAILIACLGLFGLATFTTEQRIKEIGIRKVMGASVNMIVLLLNKEFIKLVVLANLIAWPVVGWLLTAWLNQFAYHITIPWWVFLTSGLLTIIIAFLSVSAQAIRAARENPVNSLRNE
ncbi:MAG TPA: ABC transporter permease [Ohtaekwangia sp.]|nr:ABC transporter permease [Ohtaekwangia sp.]